MARDDKIEIFRTLYDSASENGTPLEKAIDNTTSAAGINGAIGFAFKSQSGVVILPTLTPAGAVPVDFQAGTRVQAYGEDENGDKAAFVDVAILTLTASKVYEEIEARVSCRRDTLWEVVGIEDADGTPVETLLERSITGSGMFSFRMGDRKLKYTAGTTGTLQLVVRAKNFDAASAMDATITAIES